MTNRFMLLITLLSVLSAGTSCAGILEDYRTSILKTPGLTRLYTFEQPDLKTINELSGSGYQLKYDGEDSLSGSDGITADNRAVRIDRGRFQGEAFNSGPDGFTVEIWYRPLGAGQYSGNSGAKNGTIISTGVGYWDGWRLTTYPKDSSIMFEIGRPAPVNSFNIASASGPVSGAWNHIAATWDRKTIRLYVNGYQVSQAAYIGEYYPPVTDQAFRIGYAGWGIGSINMDVEMAALYVKPLSPKQVFEHAFMSGAMPDSTYNTLADAEMAFHSKKYVSALSAFRSVKKLPEIAALLDLRTAQCMMNIGKSKDSVPILLKLVKNRTNPDWISITAAKSIISVASTTALAESEIRSVMNLPGLSIDEKLKLKTALAASLRNTGNSKGANRIMDELIRDAVKKLDYESILQLARDCAQAGDYQAAIRYYDAADMDKIPAYVKSYIALCKARIYGNQKQYKKAADIYRSIASAASTPDSYRLEAEECIKELGRRKSGMPARDPASFRTRLPASPEPGLKLYVSPKGNDTNPGSRTRPLASIAGARNRIREISRSGKVPAGGIAVIISGGKYYVKDTTSFTIEDSGTTSSPIIYRAAKGQRPVFCAGRDNLKAEPVIDQEILSRLLEEARGKVYQIDLKANGINEIAEFQSRGIDKTPTPQSELFINGKAMAISRFPNTGWLHTTKAVQQPDDTSGGIFESVNKRYSQWSKARDARVLGYFKYLWADNTIKVTAIDSETGHISLKDSPAYRGIESNMPFVFLNLLEEIDLPGEYSIDTDRGMIYFYPPKGYDGSKIAISVLKNEILALDGVKNVRFENLTFELGAGNALQMANCENCLIAGCTFRNFGGNAMNISNAKRCGILSCDIYSLGRGGITMSGGNRKTLTPGGCFVENCHIWGLSRLDRTYTPAVLLEGAGNSIRFNRFHDCASSAMRLEGNDFLIEYNDIYDVIKESDDQGGVDMWFNPSYRGNVIRYNYWHDIANDRACGQAGIRLDDAISGTVIYGNVFRKCSAGGFGAVQIHGGKDNQVVNNIMIDCNYAVSFSQWPEEMFRNFIKVSAQKALHEDVEISAPPYSTKYPALATLDQDINVNNIWNNVAVNCGELFARDNGRERTVANLILSSDPGFINMSESNYQLKQDCALLRSGAFRPIPFSEIGLYRDSYRQSIPRR